MGGWVGAFEATTLVDSDIDEHGAVAHGGNHGPGDEFGGGGAGDEDGSDHQVRGGYHVGDVVFVRHEGFQVGAVLGVQLAQPVDVDVDNGDVGAHAECHTGGVFPGDTSADDGNVSGRGAGDPAEEDAGTAEGFHEVEGAHLDGEPAGDFAHGGEQGQAVVAGDGFVGDAGHAAVHERLGAVGVGGKVQVGEEHLAVAHVWPFAGLWFFHLHDEVGVGPHLGGGGDDGGAGGFVVGVGEPGGGTSGGFHEDGVAVFGEFPNAGGGEGDAGFAGFDFFGAADNHGVFSIRVF